MKFTFYHNNINVADLDKSIEFYKKALGLKITKETEAADGSFKLVFMGDDTSQQHFPLIFFQCTYIVLFSDLFQSTNCALVPFQFNYYCRFIQMFLSRNHTYICKSFSRRHLTHYRIIFPCKIKCQIDRTTKRIFIIILKN